MAKVLYILYVDVFCRKVFYTFLRPFYPFKLDHPAKTLSSIAKFSKSEDEYFSLLPMILSINSSTKTEVPDLQIFPFNQHGRSGLPDDFMSEHSASPHVPAIDL